jgi:hypothetical protein
VSMSVLDVKERPFLVAGNARDASGYNLFFSSRLENIQEEKEP